VSLSSRLVRSPVRLASRRFECAPCRSLTIAGYSSGFGTAVDRTSQVARESFQAASFSRRDAGFSSGPSSSGQHFHPLTLFRAGSHSHRSGSLASIFVHCARGQAMMAFSVPLPAVEFHGRLQPPRHDWHCACSIRIRSGFHSCQSRIASAPSSALSAPKADDLQGSRPRNHLGCSFIIAIRTRAWLASMTIRRYAALTVVVS